MASPADAYVDACREVYATTRRVKIIETRLALLSLRMGLRDAPDPDLLQDRTVWRLQVLRADAEVREAKAAREAAWHAQLQAQRAEAKAAEAKAAEVLVLLPAAVSFQEVSLDDWELWAIVSWQVLQLPLNLRRRWHLHYLPELRAKAKAAHAAKAAETEAAKFAREQHELAQLSPRSQRKWHNDHMQAKKAEWLESERAKTAKAQAQA